MTREQITFDAAMRIVQGLPGALVTVAVGHTQRDIDDSASDFIVLRPAFAWFSGTVHYSRPTENVRGTWNLAVGDDPGPGPGLVEFDPAAFIAARVSRPQSADEGRDWSLLVWQTTHAVEITVWQQPARQAGA